eukprot:8056432-Ditylum_brightwellii.AAC.1
MSATSAGQKSKPKIELINHTSQPINLVSPVFSFGLPMDLNNMVSTLKQDQQDALTPKGETNKKKELLSSQLIVLEAPQRCTYI